MSKMTTSIAIDMPEIATPRQLGKLLQKTEAALAQDRYLRQGVPFIRVGRQIRYLRSDVLAYLEANRDPRVKQPAPQCD
jgi:hypothetical protein